MSAELALRTGSASLDILSEDSATSRLLRSLGCSDGVLTSLCNMLIYFLYTGFKQ